MLACYIYGLVDEFTKWRENFFTIYERFIFYQLYYYLNKSFSLLPQSTVNSIGKMVGDVEKRDLNPLFRRGE